MQLTTWLHFCECINSFGEDNGIQNSLSSSRFCKFAQKRPTSLLQNRPYLRNHLHYKTETLGLTPQNDIKYCVKKLSKSKMVTRELFQNLVELTWNDPFG